MNDYDPTDLEGNQAVADERDLSARRALHEKDGDFKWIMSDERGRRFVCRLLDNTRVDETSFCPNAMQMANEEGKKEMGRWLLKQIERLCPRALYTMKQENRKND